MYFLIHIFDQIFKQIANIFDEKQIKDFVKRFWRFCKKILRFNKNVLPNNQFESEVRISQMIGNFMGQYD